MVFEPLNPVVPGHMLVVPIQHASKASVDVNFGRASQVAAEIVGEWDLQANIITNVGAAAGQTIWHTHVHIVPRVDGDGLQLPWSEQQRREREKYTPPEPHWMCVELGHDYHGPADFEECSRCGREKNPEHISYPDEE